MVIVITGRGGRIIMNTNPSKYGNDLYLSQADSDMVIRCLNVIGRKGIFAEVDGNRAHVIYRKGQICLRKSPKE